MLVYPYVARWINSELQKGMVHEFQTQLEDKPQKEKKKIVSNAKKCNSEIFSGKQTFQDPFESNKEKLRKFKACLGITSNQMFGAIEIPRLNLLLPLYLGATNETLSKGVGQVEGSSIPIGGKSTHTVLAGHRGMGSKEMFANLDKLKSGDRFYLYTMAGTLTYKVYKQEVIYPYQTNSLEIVENKDLATLITCHPYGFNYQRLLVHGERVVKK